MPSVTSEFFQLAEQRPELCALDFRHKTTSFRDLAQLALRVSSFAKAGHSPFVAILGQKSPLVYASLFGIIAAGKAYIPLHSSLPEARLREMVTSTSLRSLVIGEELVGRLGDWSRLFWASWDRIVVESRELFQQLTLLLQKEALFPEILLAEELTMGEYQTVAPSTPAYMLFTSGSTGKPKGIIISQKALSHYCRWVYENLPLPLGARCSQLFELSFDLSVHDIIVQLSQGACLVVPEAGDHILPYQYLTQRSLEYWFSVPSLLVKAKQLGCLRDNSLLSLRRIMCCGEAFPRPLLEQLEKSAPHASLVNLYGPTEATIAMTAYFHQKAETIQEAYVPIGKSFVGLDVRLCSAHDLASEEGELQVSGPQLAESYWQDPEKTQASFIQESGKTWYKTGDRVRRDSNGILHFLGRLDYQVKLRGYRIEVQEIEHCLQAFDSQVSWLVLPWPKIEVKQLLALGLGADPQRFAALKKHCQLNLPDYMVPEIFLAWSHFPQTLHGKLDRNRIYQELEELWSQKQI